MSLIKIRSDNPRVDQWKLIGQYSYPTNINRYAQERGLTPTKETVDYVAGCIRQSEAYFRAAETAPLDISPLQLYYGATNLLAGAAALLSGVKSLIQHHGMTLHLPTSAIPRIGDYEVKPIRPQIGALQRFADVYAAGCVMTNGDKWKVEEIFGSIPDLIPDFETCYQSSLPSCWPVVQMKGEIRGLEFLYDGVETSLVQKYPEKTLDLIANYASAYIPARYNIPSKYVNLYYKSHSNDIGIYSIFGQKYLSLIHVKGGTSLSPPQLILMFMGLYALGYLSRYYPERWNPFVRSDDTGERLVVERFMGVCQRYFPNLVLNEIKKQRVQFIYEIETPPAS